MSVETRVFGLLDDGRAVHCVTLKNASGTTVSLLDYGATIQSFVFEGTDILLGYDDLAGYVHANGSYIGATIGRTCNRIADGRITVEGTDYQLAFNDVENNGHLHGGMVGFDKKIWTILSMADDADPSVLFKYVSPDGEENYPGTVRALVRYTLLADNTLAVAHEATTDRTTCVNLTNHSYFNLRGYADGNAEDTMLMVNAAEFTPVDDNFVPLGYAPVEGTALDLREFRRIGDVVASDDENVRVVGGIDHNFVLSRSAHEWHLAAEAYDGHTGLRLTCYTDLPGVQVYSGNFLNESAGKNGCCWKKRDGFCLETQYFPDTPHHPDFPSILLRPGETYRALTHYRISRD